MKKILLVDVETINLHDKSVFDFSYAIIDELKIVETGAYVIEEVYEKIDLAYYKQNKERYEEMLKSGQYIKITSLELRVLFNRLVSREDIEFISAFNLKFDIAALSHTFKVYANGTSELSYEKLSKYCKIIDVGVVAAVACSLNDFYEKFCRENNLLTDKGNLKTTAEVFYAFITDNPLHVEKHIGLFDILEEYEIFSYFYPLLNANMLDVVYKYSYNKTPFFRLLK